MASTLVVKVKCGDTLRRFSTTVCENGRLGMDVEQLREKMRGLFNLAVDDDFTLTYTDTDGDSVTIVEDCDLDDVVLQGLNPVRMVLTLKAGDKSGSFNERQSTPVDSNRIRQSIENIQTSVEKAVKTVPEPLRGVLLKLTRDLAATASAPVIADIIHSASKIGESFAGEGSQSFARESNVAEGKTSGGLSGSESNTDAKVKAKEIDSGACRVPDLNHAPPPTSGFAPTVDTCSHNNGKRETGCPMFANGGSLNADVKPFTECPFSMTRVSYKGDRSAHFKRSHSHSESAGPVSHTGVLCDGCGAHPITGPRFKSKVRHNYDLCSLCYQKSGNEAEYVRIGSPMPYHHIMKALHRKREGHGPRSQGYGPFTPVAAPYVPFTVNPLSQMNQVKLDSRFISDVNVVAGTMMAPLTPFTKIWRLQNNGNVVWPVGTKLVWTDGDKFSNALSVDLEIPATGVPVEGEIDAAVDFAAPELPGEYVSYWRMSSASGQKFGQRVWVAILVDALPDTPSNMCPAEVLVTTGTPKVVDLQSTTATPLVTEPVSGSVTGKGPVEDSDQNQEYGGSASETKESAINDQEMNFPINDFLLVGDAFSNATAPPSYPIVDASKIESGATPVNASPNMENLAPGSQSVGYDETEESLLKNLSEMGFSQVELNREILRKNGYNMEKAVVDLGDISEWDPIMDELEEMGFSDKKKNAILLVKNKGSIKRVVMDLVSGDQPR